MKSRLIGWVFIIIGVVTAVRTGTNVYRLWKAGDQVIEQQKAVEQAKAENDRLKKELSRVSDPAVIEKEARDKLGYGRPGETIVIIPQSESTKSQIPSSKKEEANWRKWWDLYIGI